MKRKSVRDILCDTQKRLAEDVKIDFPTTPDFSFHECPDLRDESDSSGPMSLAEYPLPAASPKVDGEAIGRFEQANRFHFPTLLYTYFHGRKERGLELIRNAKLGFLFEIYG